MEIYGINEAGIWKKAHGIARQFGTEAQDAFNDIVVAALELVVSKPEITEKSPAYLLVAATNTVRNQYAKQYHSYFEKQGHTEVSYDIEMAGDDDEEKLSYADTVLQFTYDYETAITVRDIISGLDETGKQVASFLYDGYKASEIARLTGMYPMQVSRVVKNLRTQMEAALL